jgi:hypothetical protein
LARLARDLFRCDHTDGIAVPDIADIAETITLVAAVTENLMSINSLMVGRAIAESQGAVGL